MGKLKACPFCGGEAKLTAYNGGYFNGVDCSKCGVHGTVRHNAEDAIAAWNKRFK